MSRDGRTLVVAGPRSVQVADLARIAERLSELGRGRILPWLEPPPEEPDVFEVDAGELDG